MNKKGFTLIELLTVIAILGILVLLAAPKFLGYTEKANLAKIQTGIKAVETAVDLKSLEDPEFTADLLAITSDKLQEINDSGKIIDKNGFIKEELEGGRNVPLEDLDVKWNSGGEFILDNDGESVYYYNKNIKVSKVEDGSDNIPGESNNENKPDGITINADGSVTLEDGTNIPLATDDEFKWINTAGVDHWHYTGEKTSLVLPSTINGEKVTSAYYMFIDTSVEKVISLENEITNMRAMFQNSQATSLDLSKLDTSKVTDMRYMFYESRATSINVSSFDTSNVTNMSRMFFSSPATTLDLSSFDTSNVAAGLRMSSMFQNSSATTGYARTQADADKLNGSSDKPDGLNFTVE